MAVNTDANYKTGSNKSVWNELVYQIDPTDNIQGSESIELINPQFLDDPFGIDDKFKIDLINNLSNLNKQKSLVLFGYGDPNIEINKHLSVNNPYYQSGDDIWWGYKQRIDDYENGFHYTLTPPGEELGQILVDGNGDSYSIDGYTITELAENRDTNFGITADNYQNIFYIDLTDTDETGGHRLKNGFVKIWRISTLGSSTRLIFHPNVVYTYPDVRDIQDATHINWLGKIITDPDWLNSIYFNRKPTAINENQNEVSESITLYSEPTWSFVEGFYIRSIKILHQDDSNKYTNIRGVSDEFIFEDQDLNKINLIVNTLVAEKIDVTTLNQLQINDKEMLVNSENPETGNGLYSVNRIDDDNVSLKYNKTIDRFELRDEADNLLKLRCKKVLINGQEDIEYDDDVVITNQSEFDTVFDGTIFEDETGAINKIRINPGDYVLNNDIDIQRDSLSIYCLKGAVIKLSNGMNIKNSSGDDVRDLNLTLNIEDSSTGLTDILDLTNIRYSKINLNVNNVVSDNVIKGGYGNKIDIVVTNSSIQTNIFEASNSYITGSLETDSTGDKFFNNCTRLILMCNIDGTRIMGSENYDF
jgi:hypothetical protein